MNWEVLVGVICISLISNVLRKTICLVKNYPYPKAFEKVVCDIQRCIELGAFQTVIVSGNFLIICILDSHLIADATQENFQAVSSCIGHLKAKNYSILASKIW